MTNNQKTEYWWRWHSFQKRYEGIFAPKVRAALKEQINQFIESGTTMAVNSAPIYPVLVELYTTVGAQWAHKSDVMTRTLKSRMPMGFSERIVQLMRAYYSIDLLNDAEGLTQTTREQIQKVLSEAAELGWSYADIVKKLQSADLTAKRARLIARTETVTAANGAALVQAQESPGYKNKIWIATRDRRTRPHHREVDNHIVGLSEDFNVGGIGMASPGDKRGGAANCCNCRCVVAMVPLD